MAEAEIEGYGGIDDEKAPISEVSAPRAAGHSPGFASRPACRLQPRALLASARRGAWASDNVSGSRWLNPSALRPRRGYWGRAPGC